MPQIQNGIYPFENIFKLCAFKVPQYQRAYTWEEDKQVKTFLADLREQAKAKKHDPGRSYFMGTLLLHDNDTYLDIVDGQQRLTTTVIFMAAALKAQQRSPDLCLGVGESALKEYYIFNTVEDRQKFLTIDEDNPFFRGAILGFEGEETTPRSRSARRIEATI
jgi:uncharacterized protein with ParB-like and HNH nuclease domain